jgi:hypothetical protein
MTATQLLTKRPLNFGNPAQTNAAYKKVNVYKKLRMFIDDFSKFDDRFVSDSC